MSVFNTVAFETLDWFCYYDSAQLVILVSRS